MLNNWNFSVQKNIFRTLSKIPQNNDVFMYKIHNKSVINLAKCSIGTFLFKIIYLGL